MRRALLLVDVQQDFLARPGLEPAPAQLLPRLEQLLAACRAEGLPVLHVQTVVRADGSDAMPHWRALGRWPCVEGSAGARAPAGLEPLPGETVVAKQAFSGFASGALERALRAAGVQHLLVAGLYTHGCVRATVLDAYARGLEVTVVSDAVASPEPGHAEHSRHWLEGRAARFVPLAALGLAACTPGPRAAPAPASLRLPVARAAGRWQAGEHLPALDLYDPCDRTALRASVPLGGAAEVDDVARACHAQAGTWAAQPWEARRAGLLRWEGVLRERAGALAALAADEVGKPLDEAREELARALGHLRAAVALADASAPQAGAGFTVRYRPLGVVAVVTPWNNPFAIPVGKLAPALAFGNGVLWKPAPAAARCSRALVETLEAAGLPGLPLGVVLGDGETGRLAMAHPRVAAVTLTGSGATGRAAARLCAGLGRPLQAELGGNNAALVMPGCDLRATARLLAASAFGFAGQRCTATRRLIVHEALHAPFTEALLEAVAGLRVGDPREEGTQVGPLLSPERVAHVQAVVQEARTAGGRVLAGGAPPSGRPQGCWFLPTVIDGLEPAAAAVREETFGPVAVLMAARDLEHALALAHGVRHGLVATLFSPDPALQERFRREMQAGILRTNPSSFPIHPEAPFGGWGDSGLGPPEHGRWDREAYARVQVEYHRTGDGEHGMSPA